MNERADLDVEIGRRRIVRAAPDRKERHSRRIQPRSLLSLLLSVRRPLSPRPPLPRKGCTSFPSTRSTYECIVEALHASDVRVKVSCEKFQRCHSILRYRIDANYKNYLSRRQEPCKYSIPEEEIARLVEAARLRYLLIPENGEKNARY